jgi:hypothetical protein
LPLAEGRQDRTCLLVTSESGLAGELDGPGVADALGQLREAADRGRSRGLATTLYIPDNKDLCGQFPCLPPPLTAAQLAGGIRSVEQAVLGRRHFTYVLLAGGGSVIPFWRLANPAADSDADFPSDAPYGVPDPGDGIEACLIPDRAVARIPLVGRVGRLFTGQPSRAGGIPFGLSAAIWKDQARKVYSLVTDRELATSPPVDLDSFRSEWLAGNAVLYFNVHGSRDERYWYGQQDLSYPKVLSPEVVARSTTDGSLVMTEACYGGLVEGKHPQDSIALGLLAGGTAALVGSSAVAYGSPEEGLSEADLFAHLFLKRVAAGERFGNAFVESKTDFAAEMLRRQGYLDGDDKKTLLEFNLFGDPSASLAGLARGKGSGLVIPEEIIQSIKQLAAARFPEMRDVEPDLTEEMTALDGALAGKVLKRRPQSTPKGGEHFIERKVFVASFARQVVTGDREVERVVRITFDERGVVLKIVTSK